MADICDGVTTRLCWEPLTSTHRLEDVQFHARVSDHPSTTLHSRKPLAICVKAVSYPYDKKGYDHLLEWIEFQKPMGPDILLYAYEDNTPTVSNLLHYYKYSVRA